MMPGDRVLAFDYRLFKDDKTTPLSITMKPATIIRRYGCVSKVLDIKYPDLCDIDFDHRGESRGHFTNTLEVLSGEDIYVE